LRGSVGRAHADGRFGEMRSRRRLNRAHAAVHQFA
jgi:hypothetical protein